MTTREDVLMRAKAAEAANGAEIVPIAGELARLACADERDDEALASLADEAETTLARWARTKSIAGVTLPDTPALARWLADPRGTFAAALDELDTLGQNAAGIAALAPDGKAARDAADRVVWLASEIARVAATRSGDMLEAAIAASERIALHGVVPGPDDALLALADVVGARLRAALRGDALDTPAALRTKSLDPALAHKLGEALAKALRRSIEIAPDMLELGPIHAATTAEVVLHEDAETEAAAPIEIVRGVWVARRGREIDVTFDETTSPVLLVPIVAGEPGVPLPSRGGASERERVFDLGSDDDADGYALVLGDRVTFLRRA